MGMRWNSALGLSVFSLGPCYQKAWLMGFGDGNVVLGAACLGGVYWWQAFRRRKPQRWACRIARVLSVGWFDHIRTLDTFLFVLLRGICSGLGPSEGGIVYGLFSKEALFFGKASVNRTHCDSQNISKCLYRPSLKDGSKPRYRLLRRRLWGVRFFPSAFFPAISQTLAAEALAIGSDGQCEGCGGGTSTTPQGERGPTSGPPSTAVQLETARGAPWESIWGCSAVKEALSNQFQSKPVQFPGALGLDIPFSSLCTAHIREEYAYCGSQGPIFLFDLVISWGYSWRKARKARTSQTFRGSGCQGGLGGRLRRTSMGLANRVSNFLSFPPYSVLHPGFGIISCGFIL